MNTQPQPEQQELDFGDPLAIERETIMVHMIVTEIATPLAKAFATMAQSGLISTRYACYCDAVAMMLKKHVVDFRVHSLNIDATIERIWRAARAEL